MESKDIKDGGDLEDSSLHFYSPLSPHPYFKTEIESWHFMFLRLRAELRAGI